MPNNQSNQSNFIKSININNFTVFDNLSLDLSSDLNIIMGGNSSGKTQLMKLLYAFHEFVNGLQPVDAENKERTNLFFAEKIRKIFLIENVGRLSTRIQGHKSSNINILDSKNLGISLEFSTRSQFPNLTKYDINKLSEVVFIPSREILSIIDGFLGSYQLGNIRIEELYANLAAQLQVMERSELSDFDSSNSVNDELFLYVKSIEDEMNSKIEYDTKKDSFYMRQPGIGNIEISLVADGYKKMGIINRLIKNGIISTKEKKTIFIDEPETSMNPSMSKTIAELILVISKFHKVYIATHDYFILKHLELLKPKFEGININYINLYRNNSNDKTVRIESSNTLTSLNNNKIFMEFENIQKEILSDFWN